MKILQQLLIIIASAFLDLSLNGLAGRLICVTTPLVFAYHVSFYSPRILMFVCAFLVVTQAFLYNATTPFFNVTLMFMLLTARFFNKLLREDRWVRWILGLFYFFIFLAILPCWR